jgi:hypothetical protein
MAGMPRGARFLVESRIDLATMRHLPAGEAWQELHRWLVLDYPSAGAARAALTIIERNPTVFAEAHQDFFGQFSSTSPTDPLWPQPPGFPATPNSASHGLMGMLAAWDYLSGHAYVAVLDNGVMDINQSFHPDLFEYSNNRGNLRRHFSRKHDGRRGRHSPRRAVPIRSTRAWDSRGGHHRRGRQQRQGVGWGVLGLQPHDLRITPENTAPLCTATINALAEAMANGARSPTSASESPTAVPRSIKLWPPRRCGK